MRRLVAASCAALRLALGVPRIAVVGHSFGGLLALEYAAKYPANTSHVAFVAGLWDTDLQCRLRGRRLAELRPEAYARVAKDTVGADGKPRNHCGLEFTAFSGAEREAYNRASWRRDSQTHASSSTTAADTTRTSTSPTTSRVR